MKKLFFGAAILFLMASCSGKRGSEQVQADSAQPVDTIAKVEAATDTMAQTPEATATQDTVAKVEKAEKAAHSKHEKLVNQFVAAAKKLKNSSGKLDFDEYEDLVDKCGNLQRKVAKVKNELTPEELEQYQKAKSTCDRLIDQH